MVERSEPFRAFRIEEDDEGEGSKGRMVDIGLSDLNEGELVVGTRYSNLNYKDALAATGAGKIAWRLPIVGGIDVAGTVETSEDPAFEPGDEVLITGFGLSEDRDGGYSEVTRLRAGHALKVPEGLDAKRRHHNRRSPPLRLARTEKVGACWSPHPYKCKLFGSNSVRRGSPVVRLSRGL